MGYRIGLILGTKMRDYPRMLRVGVQNTLEGSGHTLVCLADLIPYHTHYNGMRSFRVVFELARQLDLDAVIVPIGTICGYLNNNTELTSQMLNLLDPGKTLVIERDMPGYRCITKDNTSGMRSCIRYLIEESNYTRIAFISGSAASKGAREREAAYFEQMEAHGLDVPDGYFVRGDFSGECRDVIEKLLDEHPEVEAIACASDLIAFTVYKIMFERRLEVGRDIAVTGFDGHHDAARLDPPLATVNMTGYDYGCMAAREVIRLCEGLPPKERTLTGSFIARESCGMRQEDDLAQVVALLSRHPFPQEEVVELLMDASLQMASFSQTASFREQLDRLMSETRDLFLQHLAQPYADIELFPPLNLARLFRTEFRSFFSLEGYHTAVITLLNALAQLHPEHSDWITEQASLLHLHVARLLDSSIKSEVLETHLREWQTLQLTEDAMREDAQPQEAYRLMLSDLDRIGVRWADLFLLDDAADVMGPTPYTLAETLWHVGSLDGGATEVSEAAVSVAPQDLMHYALSRHAATPQCTVGSILAGNELLGFIVMDGGALDDNGQLVVLINMGLAIKHLQTMASIREMNELLRRNNLRLARESQRDEMTGLLNRRGLHDGVIQAMQNNIGTSSTLLYVDLDGLKYINDTFGHEAGDVAIKATARILQESLPDDCLVARMGGDEYVAFSLGCDEDRARALVGALEENVERENEARDQDAMPYELALSVGAVCFAISEDYETDLTGALLLADERMYEAKQQHHRSHSYHGSKK